MTGTVALPAKTCQTLTRHWRVLGFLLMLWACYRLHPLMNTLDEVASNGELHVVGVAGPTTFLPHADAARGLQYELLRDFADELGVRLVLEQVASPEAVIERLRSGEADLGITGLSSDDPRLDHLPHSQPYVVLEDQLITRRTTPASTAIQRIAVPRDSAEARTLRQQQPHTELVELKKVSIDKLLQLVNNGEVDGTVVNAAEFAARRALFPALQPVGSLRQTTLSWVLRRKDDKLQKVANAFLEQAARDGTLDRLTAFYGQGKTFDGIGADAFQRDMSQRLPLYRKHFEQQAGRQGMDWRLLAAIGYQESHWDSLATSPTGVRGLMMLTEGTASEMGVSNRRNATESIRAGAAYYRVIDERLPASVREPDRTWMVLAAYNMGPGHVLRARQLASAAGDDPDKWRDVSRHLRSLPRAGQALVYVQQVRRYYDALLLQTQPEANGTWLASVNRPWRVVY